MYKCNGGGADTSVVTASAGDVLNSKVIVDANGNPLTGTMPNRGAVNQQIGVNGSYTIPQGYHNGSGVVSQSINNLGAVSHSLGVNGRYTIPEGYHNGGGVVSQNIPTLGAQTITPKTYAQSIAAGCYLTGAQTIAGDSNLVAANIKQGVSIFGVAGTLSMDVRCVEMTRENPPVVYLPKGDWAYINLYCKIWTDYTTGNYDINVKTPTFSGLVSELSNTNTLNALKTNIQIGYKGDGYTICSKNGDKPYWYFNNLNPADPHSTTKIYLCAAVFTSGTKPK